MGSGAAPHFSSYSEACEWLLNFSINSFSEGTCASTGASCNLYQIAYLAGASDRLLLPPDVTTPGVSKRDQNGVPSLFYCPGPISLEYRKSDESLHSEDRVAKSAFRAGTGCTLPKTLNPATGSCELPYESPKNPPGNPCLSTPNPINKVGGNKHFDFVDVEVDGLSPLRFNRHYNSFAGYYYQNLFGTAGIARNPVGLYWYHNYYYGLIISSASELKLTRNTGQTFIYKLVNAVWQADADVNYKLLELKDAAGIRTGWQVTTPDNALETYSAIGDLLTIKNSNGISQTLTYSCSPVSATCPVATPSTVAPYTGLLIKVSDSFGKNLNFTYTVSG